ncbi:B12-binding domain-containing radical SAM protein [Candidatus Altiarchaeota archaeon]
MSSILFVEKKLRTDKLGILYLSRILKDAGHKVDLVQDDLDNTDQYLRRNHVDFIIYSVTTGDHEWYIKRNRELKKRHKFSSIMGGPHFTYYPEDGLSDSTVDYVVIGPGEDVILDIVKGRMKDRGVMGHIPNDINKIPTPDRSILYKYGEFGKAGIKRFIAGRDCPNSCKYCFNHLYHRLYQKEKEKFFQITSPDKMIQEIKEVRETYGLKLAYFNDDDLARDHNWLVEFCEKYKKEVGLPFCGSIRANNVDYNILKIMADAGCCFLNIALESANPKTQKFLRRGNITNRQIEEACYACGKLGIKVRLQNMIGLPVENPLEDALETLEFNLKINPTDSWASIFQPFPKTDLWEYCIQKGLIGEGTQCKNFYEDTVLTIPDAEKINRLHKWWFFIVKYQMPMEMVRILLELPLTNEQKSKIQNLRWEIAKDLLYRI